MNESTVRATGKQTAHEFLLAWSLALQPGIDLDDTSAIPKALLMLPVPKTVPEELHDHFRVSIRDTAAQVLHLAATIRRELLP